MQFEGYNQKVIIMLRKILINSFFCILSIGFVQAQTVLNEDEVSIKVIAKFYGAFPRSEMVEWKAINGEDYLTTFMFGGNTTLAWLDSRGNVVKEEAEGRTIPKALQTIFDEKYGNYKIREVKSQMDHQTGLGEYHVVLKTKEHGEFQMKLDQDFVVMENKSGFAYQ